MQFTKEKNGKIKYSFPLQLTPDVVSLARTVDASISTSTEIVFNVLTTYIQVYAVAKDVYLKWGTDDVTASNFDEVVPAGQIIHFLVPNGVDALNILERESGATVIIIEK